MAAPSTILRWLSAAGGGISRILRSPKQPCIATPTAMTMMNNINDSDEEDEVIMTSTTLPSTTSPWLMLSPTFESGHMLYNFYSLSEAKLKSYNKRIDESESESPDDDAKIVGSSHGWLALFNNRNNDLFLSNPLSPAGQQHIKLPPVDTLPEPDASLRDGHATISKVIISFSPKSSNERCVAVMTYGPADQLAFCFPGHSTEWTPVYDPYTVIRQPFITYTLVYDDIVHRPTPDSNFSVIQSFFGVRLEDWGTDEPTPTEVQDWNIDDDGKTLSLSYIRNVILTGEKWQWWVENKEFVAKCLQIPHLVVYATEEKQQQLFFVLRFLMPVRPDGAYDDGFCGWSSVIYRYKTVGFSLFKLDDEDGLYWTVVEKGSLEGLTMFVGINHSFALSADKFPELKPNSIYFTHPHQITPKWDCNVSDQDVGIFDFENKTFHPWFDICDVDQRLKGIGPPLVWFTPSKDYFLLV